MNAVKTSLIFLSTLVACSCSSSDSDSPATAGASSQNDSGGTASAPSTPPRSTPSKTWSVETISDEVLGKEPALAVSDGGTVGVAFYASELKEGLECSELAAGGTSDLPNKFYLPLYYANRSGGDWSVSSAYETLVLSDASPGVDLHFKGETALMSTVVGEPYGRLRYCASNDLGILTADGDEWSLETIVEDSNEAAADNSPEIAEAAEASELCCWLCLDSL